jgi:hypothetical protein
MAELLGQSADQWIALAGRMPKDLTEIIKSQPEGMPALHACTRSWSLATSPATSDE